MVYQPPSIDIIQQFQEAAAALGIPSLPGVVVGPAYQMVSNDMLGSYDGTELISTWFGSTTRLGSSDVDLGRLDSDILASAQYPIEISLRNIVKRIAAEFSDGFCSDAVEEEPDPVIDDQGEEHTLVQPNRFLQSNLANRFENVVAGDVVKILSSEVDFNKFPHDFTPGGTSLTTGVTGEDPEAGAVNAADGVISSDGLELETGAADIAGVKEYQRVIIKEDINSADISALTITQKLYLLRAEGHRVLTVNGPESKLVLEGPIFGDYVGLLSNISWEVKKADGISYGGEYLVDTTANTDPQGFDGKTAAAIEAGQVVQFFDILEIEGGVLTAAQEAYILREAGHEIQTVGETYIQFLEDITLGFAGKIREVSYIVRTSDVGEFKVTFRVNNNLIAVDHAFTEPSSAIKYDIRRNVSLIEIPREEFPATDDVYHDDGITISSTGVTVVEDFVYDDPIISADVYASYRALRTDLSNTQHSFKDNDAVEAMFGIGSIVPANIAPFAISLGIQVLQSLYPVTAAFVDATYHTNELQGFTDVLTYLSTKKTDIAYAIAMLSHNPAIHQLADSHTELYGAITSKWRIAFINKQLVSSVEITSERISTGGSNGFQADGKTFRDSGATFITDGVQAGRYIEVSGFSAVATPEEESHILGTRHYVELVNSNNELVLRDAVYGDLPPVPYAVSAVEYVVTRDYTRDEEATYLAAYASAFGNRRVISIWPDVLEVSYGGAVVEVPGYFAASTFCAYVTGLPSQQGFTNMGIVGFIGLKNSNDRYTDEQLNVIAGGGNLVLVQDVAEAPLRVRHQLTTDVSTILFQELSVTKNIDFISMFLYNSKKKFIGQYNVTTELVSVLKTVGDSTLQYLKEAKIPKFGAPLRSGELLSVDESETEIDTVAEVYDINGAIPLNKIRITLLI